MTHVSKHKLPKKVSDELFSQLSLLVAKSSKSNASYFLQELLTQTEQVMLAKRLAVMLMFHGGCSTYKAYKTLKMSKSTIIDMHQRYEEGEYREILKMVGHSKAEREKIWKMIELILRGGMPSRGKNRWAFLKTSN